MAPAASNRYLLIEGRSAANPPAAVAAVDRLNGQTDGRTDGHPTVTQIMLRMLGGRRHRQVDDSRE